jgi:hypothetical protein
MMMMVTLWQGQVWAGTDHDLPYIVNWLATDWPSFFDVKTRPIRYTEEA